MSDNAGIANQMSFGNQAEPKDLLKATWDIMVDDGSAMHQLISLQTLWPFLRRPNPGDACALGAFDAFALLALLLCAFVFASR